MSDLYLHLFHGRNHGDELDGWGFNGPCFGPLEHVTTTYATHVKLGFKNEADAVKFGLDPSFPDLTVNGDCLVYDGHLFGDWTVSAEPGMGLYRIGDEQFEASYTDAHARLQPGQSLVDLSGDGEVVVCVKPQAA